jgi:hypothetical protein
MIQTPTVNFSFKNKLYIYYLTFSYGVFTDCAARCDHLLAGNP